VIKLDIKKAVIVAAGISSRLYPLTLDKPKGLLKVNNKEILLRSVELLQAIGIKEFAVVVGYKRKKIMDLLGDKVQYIFNPFYQQCNNMGSLWFAKDFVQGKPFVYLHSDIVYHKEILAKALRDFKKQPLCDISLITDFRHTDEEAMKVLVDDRKCLIESNKEIDCKRAAGEWTGIAFIRENRKLFEVIEKVMFEEGLHYYDTHAFTKLAQGGETVFCSPTYDLPWIEIDFKEDYERAEGLFKDERV